MGDPLRIWSIAKSVDDIREQVDLQLPGDTPGLEGYWQFNGALGDVEGAAASVPDVGMSGAAGVFVGFGPGGFAPMAPKLITSTVPVYMIPAFVEENGEVEIGLTAYSVETRELDFYITTLPVKGSLYDGEDEIEFVPYVLTGPKVTFKPAVNERGEKYATFGFTASDSTSLSNEGTVLISVVHPNHPPRLFPIRDLTTSVTSPVMVRAQGADIDMDRVSFVITTLPNVGYLMQVANDTSAFSGNVTDANTTVTHVMGDWATFAYVPVDNFASDMYTTTVGVVAFDGSHYSAEEFVTITVHSDNVVPPLSGVRGNALLMDGLEEHFALKAPEDLESFSLAFWFKTNGVLKGCDMVSAPFMTVTFEKVLGALVWSMGNNTVEYRHAAADALNDGGWHSIVFAVDADAEGAMRLFVDGELAASAEGLEETDLPAKDDVVTIGTGVPLLVDEVVLAGVAADADDAAAMGTTFFGTEEFLMSYYTFNQVPAAGEFVVVDSTGYANNATAMGGVLVASTAPLSAPAVETQQDTPVSLPTFLGTAANGGGKYEVLITELPAMGTLTQADGSPIEFVPTLVLSDDKTVMLHPSQNEYGDEEAFLPYLYSQVKYVTLDPETGLSSTEETVNVIVTPCPTCVNTPPLGRDLAFSYSTLGDISFELVGVDAELDELDFTVTTLPAQGMLYKQGPGGVRGEQITVPGTHVNPPRLVYSPTILDGLDRLGFAMSPEEYMSGTYEIPFIGYTVTDKPGNLGDPRTSEHHVLFKPTHDGMADHLPVAGDRGHAAFFDGYDDVVVVEGGAWAEATTGEAGFTVEAYVKTTGGVTRSQAIVACPGFQLGVDRVLGGMLAVTTASNETMAVYTMEPLNDGVWHFLTGVWDGVTMKIFVDGEEKASRSAFVSEGLRGDGLFTIGAKACVEGTDDGCQEEGEFRSHFTGIVDEVRVWSMAMEPAFDAAASPKLLAIPGPMEGLVGYWRFNEAMGDSTFDWSFNGGEGAVVDGKDMFVVSGAPFGDVFRTPMDQAIAIPLQVGDEEVAARPAIQCLPNNGTLYTAVATDDGISKGEVIKDLPYVINEPHGFVVYEPFKGWMGADPFCYSPYVVTNHTRVNVTGGNVTSLFGPAVTATVDVEHVFVPPFVSWLSGKDGMVVTPQNTAVTIRVEGQGDPMRDITMVISTLPLKGALYQVTESGEKGPRFNAPETTVSNSGGLVIYEPLVNGVGMPYDFFKLYATDGELMSDMAIQEIGVTANLAANYEWAPCLNHTRDLVAGNYTVEMWIRAPEYNPSTLAQLEPLPQLTYIDFRTPGYMPHDMGYSVEALKTKDRLPVDIHDMRWHHVAAVFDGGVKHVYIDGKLDLAQMVMGRTNTSDLVGDYDIGASPVDEVGFVLNSYVRATMDGNGKAQGDFVGLIDELRIWNYTRPLSDIRKTMHVHISGDEEHLVYYNSFNEPMGVEQCGSPTNQNFPKPSKVNAPVAGENGYAANLNGSVYWDIGDSVEDFNATFSVELWFKSCDTPHVMDFTTLVANRDPAVSQSIFFSTDGMQYGLYYTPGHGLGWHVMNADGEVLSVTGGEYYNDGAWHQAVGTFDQYGVINLYIDGQHIGGMVMGDSHFVAPDSGSKTYIGSDGSNDMSTAYNGQIDEVSFWNVALTQAEVWGRYQASTLANPNVFGKLNHLPGKVAEFKFNDAVGQSTTSSVGTGKGTQIVAPVPFYVSSAEPSYIPSTVPINRDLVLNAAEEVCVPLYGGDIDGDVLEFYIERVPSKGKIYFTLDCETKEYEVVQAGTTPVFLPSTVGVPAVTRVIYVMGDDDVRTSDEVYDSFSYTVSDGREFARAAEVPVRVVVNNNAPQAFDTFVETDENVPVEISLNGIDPDGDGLAAYVAAPAFGILGEVVYLSGAGNLVEVDDSSDFPYLVQQDPDDTTRAIKFTFTPPQDINCPDVKFDFYLVDAMGAVSNVATVTVAIAPVNQPPTIAGVLDKTLYVDKDIIPPISVSDIDYFEIDGVLTVTLAAKQGVLDIDPLSTESPGTTSIGPFSGSEEDINRILAKVYYWRPAGAGADFTDEVLVTVSDNGANGPEIGITEAVVSITNNDAAGPISDLRFGNDGLTIVVGVNGDSLSDAAKAADGACDSIFDASTIASFGTEAECKYDAEQNRVVVALGAAGTVRPGDYLVFVPGAFGFGFEAQVSNALNAVTPIVYLNVPETIGDCDVVTFNGDQSDGGAGRALNYSWSFEPLEVDPSDPENVEYAEEWGCYLEAMTRREPPADSIEVDPRLLASGTYNLTLTVTNYLGSVSQTVTVVVTKVAQPVPSARIVGRRDLVVRTMQDLTVSGKGVVSTCDGREADALSYAWSYRVAGDEDFVDAGVTGPFFYVDKPLMEVMPPMIDTEASSAGELVYKKYELMFTVNACNANSGDCTSNAATAEVTILPSPVVAEIAGGASGQWWTEDAFVVDGTPSRDQDALGNLRYQWTCSQGTAACTTASGTELASPASTSEKWTIPSLSLLPGTYTFSLRVTTDVAGDGRFGLAATVVTFSDDPIPLVRVTADTFSNGKHNPDEPLWLTVEGQDGNEASAVDISYTWSVRGAAAADCSPSLLDECLVAGVAPDLTSPDVNGMRDFDGEVTVSGVFAPGEYGSLYLFPSVLSAGRYEFVVDATHVIDGTEYSNQVTYEVVVEERPTPVGLVATSPSEGAALTDEFTISTSGWSLEDPIRHEIGYLDAFGTFVPLTASTQNPSSTVNLPSNITEVAVRACSSTGVCTVTTSPAPKVSPLVCQPEGCSTDPVVVAAVASARDLAATGDYQDAMCKILVLIEEINTAGAPAAGEAVARHQLRQEFTEIAIDASQNGISDFKQVYTQERNFYAPPEINTATRSTVIAFTEGKMKAGPIKKSLGDHYATLFSNLFESAKISEYRRRLLQLTGEESSAIIGLFDTLLLQTAVGVPANVPVTYETPVTDLSGQQVQVSQLASRDMTVNGFFIPAGMGGIPATASTVFINSKQYAGKELEPESFVDPFSFAEAYQQPYPLTGRVATIAFSGLNGDLEAEEFVASFSGDSLLTVRLPLAAPYDADENNPLCLYFDGEAERWILTEEIVRAAGDPEKGSTTSLVVCEAIQSGAFGPSDGVGLDLPPPPSPPPPSPSPPPPPPSPAPPSPPPPPPVVIVERKGRSWIDKNKEELGGGLAAGVVALLLLAFLAFRYKKKKDRMRKMIDAAESQEMLEAQGLVDPMDGGMMPIKNPVAGAVRTTAILESDKV